jgi:catechol 2,3-dioxygenase-like lactoylglutathione lyase family enzyme
MIPIDRFDHIGITARDVEKTARFYMEIFGFVPFPVAAPNITVLRSGDVELAITPRTAGENTADELSGEHFAFRVTALSLDAVTAELSRHGLAYQVDDTRIALRDPDGHVVELELG